MGRAVSLPEVWFLILSEEVGEVAKAILEGKGEASITELVQVVAVIETWIDSLEEKERTVDEKSNP